MAKFNPGNVSEQEASISEEGINLNLVLPPKTFSSGKTGFFRQGMYTAPDGSKYRLNLQVYKIEPK